MSMVTCVKLSTVSTRAATGMFEPVTTKVSAVSAAVVGMLVMTDEPRVTLPVVTVGAATFSVNKV